MSASEIQKHVDEQLRGFLDTAITALQTGRMTFRLTMGDGVSVSIELLGEMFVKIDRLLSGLERKATGKRREIAWCIERFGIVTGNDGRQLVEVAIVGRKKSRVGKQRTGTRRDRRSQPADAGNQNPPPSVARSSSRPHEEKPND